MSAGPAMTRRGVAVAAAAVGTAGAIATAIGFAVDPAQAAFSYLTAWAFALSIALGALIFALIGHAVDARWTIVFQRFTEAITSSLPVLAIGFLPVALAAGWLYPWADPAAVAALDPEAAARLAHKAGYLNVTAWSIRAVVYLALWIAIAELVARWSARSSRSSRSSGSSQSANDGRAGSDASDPIVRARGLSAAALPAVGLTLTFASFDWLMSLTPQWYSTIFGLLYFSGGFVAALSLVAVIARAARGVPEVAAAVGASHTGALGRMMFAFLVFWAYMELAQGLIIWIANKPDEVPWYIARGAGRWGGVFALLVIGHFAAPFFVLLSRPLKRRPGLLAIAGGWLVAMHYVDVYWLVMPVLHPELSIHWLDVAAPCAVLGLSTAVACVRAPARAVIAREDPRLAAAIAYEGT
ncbi:MAG TPA: hypothetical protein VFK02_20135 [Kofleriaceae bacterium]|nr:hypothetical protein [Kofleriaceae bacterium]